MRSFLIIFLLCVSNFVGMAKNRMDSFPDGSLCIHQSELYIANHASGHSVLPALVNGYTSSELNVNFAIQNKLTATYMYIVNLPKNGIGLKNINWYYFIQKGLVFHIIFGL